MISQHASTIRSFKLCPMLYRLQRVLCLAPVEETPALRMGTNWHKCLEILRSDSQNAVEDDLIAHLDQAYEDRPPSVELADWETERMILLYSALGWLWYWQDDEVETIACEVPFKREVRLGYVRQGRIDRLIRRNELVQVGEYKSTSKPIDSASTYWDTLNLDTQITLYIIEARHAQLAGELVEYGIPPDDPLISGVLYDVWHKPKIKSKKLSQADTKKFMADGEYYGEGFTRNLSKATDANEIAVSVNEVLSEITYGKPPKPTKKNPEPETPFSIRETPEMFGARLLDDIKKNPENHFARKEISRTDAELKRFDEEYYKIARVANLMEKQNLWYVNEHQCHATYRCPYSQICQHNLDVENGNIPDGFKRTSGEW